MPKYTAAKLLPAHRKMAALDAAMDRRLDGDVIHVDVMPLRRAEPSRTAIAAALVDAVARVHFKGRKV